MSRVRTGAVAALVAIVVSVVPAAAATGVVVHGRLKTMKGLTATYTSSHGTYTASWIGKRHYRIAGRIDGARLSGTFRTRQTSSGKSYTAAGSGKLGSRSVRISGGGPNTLRTTTLILR